MTIVNALLKEPGVKTGVAGLLSPDDVSSLQSAVVGSAVQQQDLVTASMAEGGPGSLAEAILQGMQKCDVSLEKLSKKTNVSKYRLTKMLEGEMEMTPKIIGKILKVFHGVRPDIYPAD